MGKVVVQKVHLVHGAWETVEEKPGGAVILGQTIGNDGLRDVVGHIFSGVDQGLDLDAQLGAVADVVPEDVAGRYGWYRICVGQRCGLGALACSGGTHDEHSHLRNPS